MPGDILWVWSYIPGDIPGSTVLLSNGGLVSTVQIKIQDCCTVPSKSVTLPSVSMWI